MTPATEASLSAVAGQREAASSAVQEGPSSDFLREIPDLAPGCYRLLKTLVRRSVAEPEWRQRVATSPAAVSSLLACGASLLRALAVDQQLRQRRRKAAASSRAQSGSAKREETEACAQAASAAGEAGGDAPGCLNVASEPRQVLAPVPNSPPCAAPLALLAEVSVLLRLLRNLCVEGRTAQDVLLARGAPELFLSSSHVLIEALSHSASSCRCPSAEQGAEEAASPDCAASEQAAPGGTRSLSPTGEGAEARQLAPATAQRARGSQEACGVLEPDCEKDGRAVTASLLQFLSNLSVKNDCARLRVQQSVLFLPLLQLALAAPSVAPAFMLLNTLYQGDAQAAAGTGANEARSARRGGRIPDGCLETGPRCRGDSGDVEGVSRGAARLATVDSKPLSSAGEGDSRFFELLAALYTVATTEDARHLDARQRSSGLPGEQACAEANGAQARSGDGRSPAEAPSAAGASLKTTRLGHSSAESVHLEWPSLFLLQLLRTESDGSVFFQFLESVQSDFSVDTLERFAILLLAPPAPAQDKASWKAIERSLEREGARMASSGSVADGCLSEDSARHPGEKEDAHDEIQAFCDRPCRAAYIQQLVRSKLSGVGQSGLLQFLLVLFEALLDDSEKDRSQQDTAPASSRPVTLKTRLSASPAFYAFMNGQIRRALAGVAKLRKCRGFIEEQWTQGDAATIAQLAHAALQGSRPEDASTFSQFFFRSLLRLIDEGQALEPVPSPAVPQPAVARDDHTTGSSIPNRGFESSPCSAVCAGVDARVRQGGDTAAASRESVSSGNPVAVLQCTEGLSPAGRGEANWQVNGTAAGGPPVDLLLFASKVRDSSLARGSQACGRSTATGVDSGAELEEARQKGGRESQVLKSCASASNSQGTPPTVHAQDDGRANPGSNPTEAVEQETEKVVDAIVSLLRLCQQQRILALMRSSDTDVTGERPAEASKHSSRGQARADRQDVRPDTRGSEHSEPQQESAASLPGVGTAEASVDKATVMAREGDAQIWGLLQKGMKSGVLLRALANLLAESPRAQHAALEAQGTPHSRLSSIVFEVITSETGLFIISLSWGALAAR
ncbi:hypothetical protein BESB_039730 [Besnoitia besnoiti]|uniref:Uncharacterized protein n=1 Tax=Besnoitia besnoiti TaxID=94643 RepID=A0A2A9MHP8_BESBE|nr:hypothetical protein BESB_039730 [Besnoitia besnoiti]PFH37515.1 hypothetical protein BESB_039730 [Besnoitia besnoiti]